MGGKSGGGGTRPEVDTSRGQSLGQTGRQRGSGDASDPTAPYGAPAAAPATAPQQAPAYHQPTFHMPTFHMPTFHMPDYSSILQEQQAEAEQLAGEAQVQDYFTRKLDAASRAADEINAAIANESAHAKLYGLDYVVDEGMKKERINNLFAQYWTEGDESTLGQLVKQWGNAGAEWSLEVVRGNPGTPTDSVVSRERKAGAPVQRQTAAAATVLGEEEKLNPAKTALGG